jgi:hypothetical protein
VSEPRSNPSAERAERIPPSHGDAVTLLEDAFDAVVIAAHGYDERARALRRDARKRKSAPTAATKSASDLGGLS